MAELNSYRRRPLRLTRAHVEKVHRVVERRPATVPLTPLTDEDYVAFAEELLAENRGRPFWLLAYGSLIWKPAFDHVEMRPCLVPGWRRSFCLHLDNWRGTPEEPGLMLALDRGGSCKGVIYRMPDDSPQERMVRILKREVGSHEGKPWFRWVNVRAGGETLRAFGTYCAPRTPDPELVRLPIEQQVYRLARAVGHVGSCAEYLLNTVEHLEQLGLHDRYLWRMQDLVAREIEALPSCDGAG